MELKSKSAIITGGGRGIGKAIARAFLESGASVAIASRNWDELEKAGEELSKFGPVRSFRADISQEEDVRQLVREVLRTFGSVDVLVNNAGVQGPIGRFWEVDFEDWIENVRVNLIGTARCTRQVLPVMISKKAGKIINLSGGGATSPRPWFSGYGTGKAAIVRFTETLAEEVKEYHIDVNAIAPGAVNTRMLEEVLEAGGEKTGEKEFHEARDRNEKGGTPPDLAADLAVFLASPESDGLTGRLISAVWDDWRQFSPARIKEIMSGNLYTLRRVS
jgi:NAD(P)-dependent dehydrogenase (short-subunit alcohol dehydrogenase family)